MKQNWQKTLCGENTWFGEQLKHENTGFKQILMSALGKVRYAMFISPKLSLDMKPAWQDVIRKLRTRRRGYEWT